MVVLIGFGSSRRIAPLAAMAAAVMTTLLVVIVLFSIWRIGVLGPALVFVVGAVVSFVLCVVGFGFVVLRLVLMVVLIGFRV